MFFNFYWLSDTRTAVRVAVPTDESCRGVSVFRSGYFAVLELSDDGESVIMRECRKVNESPPAHEGHHHGHEEEREEHGPEHARWHLAVLNALKDVDVVVAPHMGPTMVRGLRALGKTVIVGVYFTDLSEVPNLLKEMGVLPSSKSGDQTP